MTTDVATWKRASTALQMVDNQDAGLSAHVTGRGYRVVKTFDLPDLSASKGLKRHEQALDEVIADVENGLYSKLVVFDSSRLDRRGEDEQLLFLLTVQMAGGVVESVSEPSFGQRDLGGRIVSMVAQAQNHAYSVKLGNAVKAGNARIDRAAGFRGGRPPFGFRSRCTVCGMTRGCKLHTGAKVIEPDPEEIPIVVELFERVAADQPVPVIAGWLRESHGLAKPISSITATIRRGIYWHGRHEIAAHDGTTAVHRTEPIVSKALFDAANSSLTSRDSTNARPRLPRKPDFSGRLFCGECGGKAYRMAGGDHGKRTRYYYCKSCRRCWLADLADEKVEARMLADHSMEIGMVIEPGSDHAHELERLANELTALPRRGLPDDEEDRIRRELRTRRDELAALPVIPPSRHPGFTGRIMSEVWAKMGHAERCAYLVSGEFQIRLNGRGRAVEVERVYLPDDLD